MSEEKPKRIKALSYIENTQLRKVTQYKRKKGLLKKSIELSVLCGLDIGIYIIDNETKKLSYFIN